MTTETDEDRHYAQQVKTIERLVHQIYDLLGQYGDDEPFKQGDYSIYEDYWGHPQVKVSMENLRMLQPSIVAGLQQIVKAYPGWEIVVAVTIPGHYDDWPEMGLYIRPHEIIDGLQRQYFPKEFQGIEYEGAKRGTASD
jgi:hypothetical protein